MATTVDIFNPQTSVVAHGLQGKVIMLYGGNNVGKTYQAVRMAKPFVIACESGLNAQSGVKYNKVNNWVDFKKLVKQFTHKSTIEQAKKLYSTIIIDEVYASSIFCQDYVCATYGAGAIALGDTANTRINLYESYEKEYFRQINLLVNSGYTVVFIAHAQEKDGKITPKGDKRCMNPILDACDYVFYVKANGVDENGKVIPSSAYLAETNEYFARSRFTYTPTVIPEFTANNIEEAIKFGIEEEERINGVQTVDYEVQVEQNTSEKLDFEKVMEEVQQYGLKLHEAGHDEKLTEIVEETLGAGKKVSECTKRQVEAVAVILDDLKTACNELGL